MPGPVLIILERILGLPCDERSTRFACAQQKSFVRIVVLLQAKKRDVQSGASLLVHVWSGSDRLSQSLFKLLSSLFPVVKETEENFEQLDFSFFL